MKFKTKPTFEKKAAPKRRRTRCKKCVACQNTDCTQCAFCKDMIKFGGTGKSKQSCIQRQCLQVMILFSLFLRYSFSSFPLMFQDSTIGLLFFQPMLPSKTQCMECGKDGWDDQEELRDSQPNSIMECCICYDLVHPTCLSNKVSSMSTFIK